MSKSSFLQISRRSFAIATIALVGGIVAGLPSDVLAETPDTSRWVIDAAKARELLAGGARCCWTRAGRT